MLTDTDLFRRKFEQGLSYTDFVATGQAQGHHLQWQQRHEQLALDAEQGKLLNGFARRMNVLCLSGSWCGDCALQGSAMARVAEASDKIQLRFIPKADEHADLIVPARINDGFRVPVSWFMAEDFAFISMFGDRTLSRYRSMARKALGSAANVLAPPPADPVREVLAEVLAEFERVHLLLRLSGRLREKHGD